MKACLWLGRPAPPEYIDLILKRDVYHCTPSELDAQDAEAILQDLVILETEGKVNRTIARNNALRGKRP